jgi:hypothetical protein
MAVLGDGFDEFARYLVGLIVTTEDYALFNRAILCFAICAVR